MNAQLHHPSEQLQDLPATDRLTVLCLRGLGRREADLLAQLETRIGRDAATALIARCDDLLSFLTREAKRPMRRNSPDAHTLTADEISFARLVSLAERNAQQELFLMAIALTGSSVAPCLPPLATAFSLTLTRARAIMARAQGCPVHSKIN